jgi:ABC-type antimicrobial peptide transport system permease subunit
MKRATRVLANSLRNIMVRNRLRTFFMMLGTFVGVCALVVIVAFGRATRDEVMARVNRMLSGSTIFLRSGGGQRVGGAHFGGPATTLTLDDVRAIDRELKNVVLADPLHAAGTREVVYGNRNRAVRVEGHAESAPIVMNRSVTLGDYFTARDVAGAARVALVGEVVVRELFGGRDPIGEMIRIGTVPFRVVGVLEPAGIDPHGIDKDNEIIVPVTTLMRRVLNVDYILAARLAVRPGTDMDATVREITEILRRRHALGPEQFNDFAMFTPRQVQQTVQSASRVFTLLLPLVAALTIVVGGLVVANLMLLTVNERRAEIGLRKALGARPRDIRLQFVVECAAITGLAGLAAVAAGYLILLGLAQRLPTPAGLPWGVALLGLAVALAVGTVAGIVPAQRAARLDPVQALR